MKDTFVCFDLDHTLIAPLGYEGSAAWHEDHVQKFKKLNFSEDAIFHQMIHEWTKIQENLTFDWISEKIYNIFLEYITNYDHWCILTARSDNERIRANTFKHFLKITKADFPYSVENFFKKVLFCGLIPKGEKLNRHLLSLQKHSGCKIKKVLFFDDLQANIDSVTKSLIDYKVSTYQSLLQAKIT